MNGIAEFNYDRLFTEMLPLGSEERGVYMTIVLRGLIDGWPLPYDVEYLARTCRVRRPHLERIVAKLIDRKLLIRAGDHLKPRRVFVTHARPDAVTWKQVRGHVLERDRRVCRYCGGSAACVDHVVPLSRGGSNELDNLVAACRRCNSSKSDRRPDEWEGRAVQ